MSARQNARGHPDKVACRERGRFLRGGVLCGSSKLTSMCQHEKGHPLRVTQGFPSPVCSSENNELALGDGVRRDGSPGRGTHCGRRCCSKAKAREPRDQRRPRLARREPGDDSLTKNTNDVPLRLFPAPPVEDPSSVLLGGMSPTFLPKKEEQLLLRQPHLRPLTSAPTDVLSD